MPVFFITELKIVKQLNYHYYKYVIPEFEHKSQFFMHQHHTDEQTNYKFHRAMTPRKELKETTSEGEYDG